MTSKKNLYHGISQKTGDLIRQAYFLYMVEFYQSHNLQCCYHRKVGTLPKGHDIYFLFYG